MAVVERYNVVLRIADSDIQRYLDKGYSLTDGHGNIIKQTIPNDIGELKQLVVKQQNEIAELKAKIKELTEISSEPEVEVVVKPKRGRKAKKSEE